MAESVPYGLTTDTLAVAATPAAKAVAARLSPIVCDTEFWGRIDMPAMFLNLFIFSTWPRIDGVRKLYHHVCKPRMERSLFEGIDALDLDTMPADQREAVQQVRDYRAWRIEEDRRHE